MKYIFAIILYLITSLSSTIIKAQNQPYDSVFQNIYMLKDDTAKVNLLVKTARALLYHDFKAFPYGDQIIKLSKKLNYPLGLANGYRLNGSYYADFKNEIPKGLQYYRLADSIYHLYPGFEFKEGLGAIQFCYGNIKSIQGKNAEAVEYYLKSLNILENINNKSFLPKTYFTLANLYLYMNVLDKAQFYGNKCLKILDITNDQNLLPLANITMAAILIEQKEFKEALPFITKAKQLGLSNHDDNILYLSYYNLGMYHAYFENDFTQANECNLKALEYEKKMGRIWIRAKIYNNMAYFYFKNHQFEKALITSRIAYKLSDSIKWNFMLQSALCNLALSEGALGQYQNAYHHLLLSYDLKDSITTLENHKQINNLEALYQSEKKEIEINKLQNEKKYTLLSIKKKNITIYSLFISLMMLASFGYFIYRNFHHKRLIVNKENEIQRLRIAEMENERMLIATQSVLKGEESERKRLARDLHDGLGSLLSGVKTSLYNMKGNVVLDKEDVSDFNKAVGMLDSSIYELRRLAQNMMPEALMRLGLKDTLTDFCAELSKVQPMYIDFQFYGKFKRVDSNLEINAYRIIQELVNNAIKHSEAKEMVIQMIQETNRLCFVVLDNGKGFQEEQNIKNGVGLSSIKSRVDSLNGTFELISKPGGGTEVMIEFMI